MSNVHHGTSLIGGQKVSLTSGNVPDLTDVPGLVDSLEVNLMCVTDGNRDRALAALSLAVEQEALIIAAYGSDVARRKFIAAMSREVRSRQRWSGISREVSAGFGG